VKQGAIPLVLFLGGTQTMTGGFVMKGRGCFMPLDRAIPTYCGVGSKGDLNRHRQLFLKIGLLLILCWTLSSLWLIGLRRSERSQEDVGERKATVALILPAESLNHR
jgi:hypothetical protein